MIPIIDPNNPQSWGKDDKTGLPVMHPDMVKQYEYIGNGLAWTGFMVHYKDADQPNPQLIPPRLKVDPIPIPNVRYLQFPELPNIPNNLAVASVTSTTVSLTWDAVTLVDAYAVKWASNYASGETTDILNNSYTITNLTPGTQYLVYVASIGDNTSTVTIEFSTSAFSDPIFATTSLTS